MPINDEDEAAVFDSPENQGAGGASHRPPAGRKLTTHVPVRFDPLTVAYARVVADGEGKTVSGWIRDLVRREVSIRIRMQTRTVTNNLPVAMVKTAGDDDGAAHTVGQEASLTLN